MRRAVPIYKKGAPGIIIMKSFFSKPYNVGRVTVYFLGKELIALYRGKRKTRLKKFRYADFPSRKTFVVAACAVALLAAAVLSVPRVRDAQPIRITDDEAEKARILSSSETEYVEPTDEKRVEIKIHRVKKGETLSKIAKTYGVSMETICGSNNLNSYDLVNVGMTLKIPTRDGIIHTLKSGEQVARVVQKYRVPLEKVLAANEIRNVDFYRPNQQLFIPDAKPQNLIRGFLWPTITKRAVTCGYGWRNHPIFNHRHFHKGLDIYCQYDWVRSTKYGKVTYTGWLGGYGRTVVVSHPGGWKSLYGHLSRISVRNGQYVKQGQIIGRGGNTGNSTGPHLHFELINNGDSKNPYRLLK